MNGLTDVGSPKFIGGIEMLKRTGMTNFRIGYSHDDDGPPVIWHVTGTWRKASECAAAGDPVEAVMRLCELVVDGGQCSHCTKPTILVHDSVDPGQMLESMGCVYAWDPELKTFRRGCE